MARGPIAKHASARARGNKTSTSTTLALVDKSSIEIPPMPVLRQRVEGELVEVEWHEQAKLAWAEIHSSPMFNEYVDADLPLIHSYVALVQDLWRRMEIGRSITEVAAELRQHAAVFGIGPDARRRLQWTVEEAEAAMERGRKRERDRPMPKVMSQAGAWDAIAGDEEPVEAEVVE